MQVKFLWLPNPCLSAGLDSGRHDRFSMQWLSVGALSRQTLRTCPGLGAQSKFKPVKFTCRQRGAVLTALYQAIAAARGCPISRKVLLWRTVVSWRQSTTRYHESALVPAASRAMLI